MSIRHTSRFTCKLSRLACAIAWLFPAYSLSGGSAMFVDESNHFADPIAAMEAFSTVDESEMSAMRGGLRIGSLDIDFGVNLRTLIDGVIKYETAYRLTSTGFVESVSETLSASIASTDGNNPTAPSGRVQSITVGNGTANPLADGAQSTINLSGFTDAKGIIFTDASGKNTIALHQVTQQKILSVLLSDATGHNISHDLDVDVTVNNYSEVRKQILDARRTGILSRAIDRNLR